ncbi:MAG: hypothetical protein AAF533_17085 [Acidobacteriota bacterium]
MTRVHLVALASIAVALGPVGSVSAAGKVNLMLQPSSVGQLSLDGGRRHVSCGVGEAVQLNLGLFNGETEPVRIPDFHVQGLDVLVLSGWGTPGDLMRQVRGSFSDELVMRAVPEPPQVAWGSLPDAIEIPARSPAFVPLEVRFPAAGQYTVILDAAPMTEDYTQFNWRGPLGVRPLLVEVVEELSARAEVARLLEEILQALEEGELELAGELSHLATEELPESRWAWSMRATVLQRQLDESAGLEVALAEEAVRALDRLVSVDEADPLQDFSVTRRPIRIAEARRQAGELRERLRRWRDGE